MTASTGANRVGSYPDSPASTAPRTLFAADATAVRLLTVLVTVLTGIFPMLILYLVAAVIVPERPTGEEPASGPGAPVGARISIAPGNGALVVGIVLIVGGLAALANEWLHVDWSLMWPVALIAVGGAVLVTAMRH
jgi:hypothetical protein